MEGGWGGIGVILGFIFGKVLERRGIGSLGGSYGDMWGWYFI